MVTSSTVKSSPEIRENKVHQKDANRLEKDVIA